MKWKRLPERVGKDIAPRWRLGVWVLTCQAIYGKKIGGGQNWQLSRYDGRPLRRGGSVGLFIAYWDRGSRVTAPPLVDAQRHIESFENGGGEIV